MSRLGVTIESVLESRGTVLRLTALWIVQIGLEATFETRAGECLRRAIVPGVSVVLEIGTGSGLLAMLAARLGARKVVAIEASKNMAERDAPRHTVNQR